MSQRYDPILRVGPLRQLLISSLIGRLPLGTCSLAVLLQVRACTHSYAISGVVVGALALAEAFAAPLIGRALDRFGAIGVVFPVSVVQAAALVMLGLVGHGHPAVGLLVGLGAVIGVAMPPISAASRALWPRLLDGREQRDAAFSLDATGQELAWTFGPVLVGVVAGAVSPGAAVLMVGALTLSTSAWFTKAVASLKLARQPAPSGAVPQPVSRVTRILLPVALLLGMSLGGLEVGLPALATHLSSASMGGVLLGLWSIGSLGGGVVFGARHWQIARERLLAPLLLANGLLVLPLTLSDSFSTAAVSSFVAGVCVAPIFACVSSLISDHAPADATARAFTWNTAAIVSGAAVGTALGGEIVSVAGVSVAIATAGVIGVLGAGMTLSLIGHAPVFAAPVPAPAPVRVPVPSDDRLTRV